MSYTTYVTIDNMTEAARPVGKSIKFILFQTFLAYEE